MLKRTIYLILTILLLSGCSKLSHLSQLLTLKAYSEEQVCLDNYVHNQNENFELMIKAYKSGDIYQFKNKESFLERFGEPIYSRVENIDQKQENIFLYRRPKGFFNSDKIYVYFDKKDNLLRVRYVPKDR